MDRLIYRRLQTLVALAVLVWYSCPLATGIAQDDGRPYTSAMWTMYNITQNGPQPTPNYSTQTALTGTQFGYAFPAATFPNQQIEFSTVIRAKTVGAPDARIASMWFSFLPYNAKFGALMNEAVQPGDSSWDTYSRALFSVANGEADPDFEQYRTTNPIVVKVEKGATPTGPWEPHEQVTVERGLWPEEQSVLPVDWTQPDGTIAYYRFDVPKAGYTADHYLKFSFVRSTNDLPLLKPLVYFRADKNFPAINLGDADQNLDYRVKLPSTANRPTTAASIGQQTPWGEWTTPTSMGGAKSWIYGAPYRRAFVRGTAAAQLINGTYPGLFIFGNNDPENHWLNPATYYWFGELQTRARLAGIKADGANTWTIYIEAQWSEQPCYRANEIGFLPSSQQTFVLAPRFVLVYGVRVGRNGFMEVFIPNGNPFYGGYIGGIENSEADQRPMGTPRGQVPVTSHIWSILATDGRILRYNDTVSVGLANGLGTYDGRIADWEFVGSDADLISLLEKIRDNFDTKQDFKSTVPRTADALFDNDGSGSDGGYDPGTEPTYTDPAVTLPTSIDYEFEQPNGFDEKAKKLLMRPGYSWLPSELGQRNYTLTFEMPEVLGMSPIQINTFNPFENVSTEMNTMFNAARLGFRTLLALMIVCWFLSALPAEFTK